MHRHFTIGVLVMTSQTSSIALATAKHITRVLRSHELPPMHRLLDSEDEEKVVNIYVCRDSKSFLGVGNVNCLNENIHTAIFLLAIIIVISLIFEKTIEYVRHVIHCPQLKKIVNRIFEEVMIMGFISMVIFTLNTSGAMTRLNFKFNDELDAKDRLHFYEFFHYIVFLSMIYFILIVLLLLFIGTVVPKILWEMKKTEHVDERESDVIENDSDYEEARSDYLYGTGEEDRYRRPIRDKLDYDDESSEGEGTVECFTPGKRSIASRNGNHERRLSALTQRQRFTSGMDLVQGSRAYSLLLQRYEREGWCFRFNIVKQWQVWKSFEILAYNICQNRSGYIYKNPFEMERLFGVKPYTHSRKHHIMKPKKITYAEYNVLCMRNLLYHMTHVHFSAFFVLVVIYILPVLFPEYDHWIFIGVGGILLLVNIVIFLKVLHILKGIVDDRLHVLTTREIQQLMDRSGSRRSRRRSIQRNLNSSESQLTQRRKRPTLRVVAQCIRSIIRMQMSALCHRQLHFHDHRFWFRSPRFLLRLFHFATVGQAFYLVWFTLVERQTAGQDGGEYLVPIMALLPFLALCVVTPMTMPSLVLVMSLTGIFVDLNTTDEESGYHPTQTETKTHIRLMRRSYLRSHYNDVDESMIPPPSPLPPTPQNPQQPFDALQTPGKGNDIPPPSPSSLFLRIYDSQSSVVQHNKIGPESPRRRRAPSLTASPPRRQTPSTPSGRQRWSFLDNRNDDVALLTGSQGRSDDESLQQHEDTNGAYAPVSSPRSTHRHSFDHTLTNHHSSRKINLTSPHTTMTHFKRSTNAAAAVDPRGNVQSPPQAAATFSSYCSKYGGYPET